LSSTFSAPTACSPSAAAPSSMLLNSYALVLMMASSIFLNTSIGYACCSAEASCAGACASAYAISCNLLPPAAAASAGAASAWPSIGTA